MKKKMLSLLLCASLSAALLSGCAAAGAPESDASAQAPAAEETAAKESTEEESVAEAGSSEEAADTQDNSKEGMKIAIVTSPSGVDDGSFNENNYDGILDFIAENPDATVTPVREESGDVAAAVQAVADIVADYDAIVCCGFQFAGIGSVAEANPDVDFILVDSFPTNEAGEETEYPNIYAMTFKEQEAGFCAGIAAAMESKSGKVAVVNGIAFPSNVNYQWGFESGVNYANKNLGTKAEAVEIASYAGTDVTGADVGGNYAGDFSDEATGKIIGEALIGEGVDVIFTAAGATGNGVLTAVKEADGVYYIGCDVDQYDDGADGSDNVILTSALKIMDMNVTKQLNEIKNGTFKGANILLGADTDSTGYVSEDGRQQLSDDTIKAIDEAFAKVKSGDVIPAANFNNEKPDGFTGL